MSLVALCCSANNRYTYVPATVTDLWSGRSTRGHTIGNLLKMFHRRKQSQVSVSFIFDDKRCIAKLHEFWKFQEKYAGKHIPLGIGTIRKPCTYIYVCRNNFLQEADFSN